MLAGHADASIPELERALELNPALVAGEETLAGALSLLGRDADSIAHWRRALAVAPDDLTALTGAARILSSSADAGVRNGAQAVELSLRADRLTGDKDASVLDTLAAAYAEAGRFPEAIDTASRALALANAAGDAASAQGIEGRLRLYRAGRPFRNVQ